MHNDREPAGGWNWQASSSSSQAAPALNRGIKSALRRLPTLVDRLLAIPAARCLVIDDVDELLELLSKVTVHLGQFPAGGAEGAAAVAGILDDAAVRTAMLRLVAAVVRCPLTPPSEPSSGSGSGGFGSGGCGSTSRSCGSGGGTGGSGSTSAIGRASGQRSGHPKREGSKAYAVLTEKACTFARLLLEHLPSSPAASDFVQKLLRMQTLQCIARQFAEASASAQVLTAQQVVYAAGLVSLLEGVQLAVVERSRSGQPPRERICSHLAVELRDSSVMEHAARLVLRLMLEGASGGAELAALRDAISSSFLSICQIMGTLYSFLEPNTQARAALLEVLSGRCFRHVVLVHCVAALCMADGGSSYGLPEDVRQAVSARVARAFRRGGQEASQLAEWVPVSMLVILRIVAPTPPVGGRAKVLLLLRIARLAVASGDVWAEAAHQRQAGRPLYAGGAWIIPQNRVVAVALCVLDDAWPLLLERLGADPPDWAVAAGVECWRLVAAGLGRNVLRWATPSELLTLGRILLQKWTWLLPSGEPLPTRPPPGLAAVLAGGLQPCLERLLRRAGEEPDGPEAAVLEGLLRSVGFTWGHWACLLEYGELRQAAALVATLGKLLRRASRAGASSAVAVASCIKVLAGAVVPGRAHLEAEGRQLRRLLTYAVCEWLPALSDLVLQGMAASEPNSRHLSALLRPVMVWLPLLAVRCGVEDGTAVGGAGAPDGSGGWRLLLLEEVRVVPLLGGALRLLPAADAVGTVAVAECCCAVAAAFPDEVRRAAGASAWQPEFLRALAPELAAQRELAAHHRSALVDGVEALATMLEEGRAGGSGGGSVKASRHMSVAAEGIQGAYGGLAGGLVPPTEARLLLRTCCHRGCISLAGDSEADAPMRWCRFCNAACYCCGECQLAHWREGGHKEACPGGAKARPG